MISPEGLEEIKNALNKEIAKKTEEVLSPETKYTLDEKVAKTIEHIESQTGELSAIAKGIIKNALGKAFKNTKLLTGAPLDIFPASKVGEKREISAKQARIAFDYAKTFTTSTDKPVIETVPEEATPVVEEKEEEAEPVGIEQPKEETLTELKVEDKEGKKWEGGEISKNDFVQITPKFKLVFQGFNQEDSKFLFKIDNQDRAYTQKELQTLLNQTNDLRERHYETQDDMEKSRDYYKEEAEGAENDIEKDLSIASYEVLNNRLNNWRKKKSTEKTEVEVKKISPQKIEEKPLFEMSDVFIDPKLKRQFRIIEKDRNRYLMETNAPGVLPAWVYKDQIETYLNEGIWNKTDGKKIPFKKPEPKKKDSVTSAPAETAAPRSKKVIFDGNALPPRIQKIGNTYSTTNRPPRKIINNPKIETPSVPTASEIKPDDALETKEEETLIEDYLKEFEKKMEENDLLDLDQFESPEEAAEALLLTLQEMGIPIEKVEVVKEEEEEEPKESEPAPKVEPEKTEVKIYENLSGIETIPDKIDREEIVRLVKFQIENPFEPPTHSIQERLKKYPIFRQYVQSNFERRQKSLDQIDTLRGKWSSDFFEVDGFRKYIEANTKEKVIELVTKKYDDELDKIIGRTIK